MPALANWSLLYQMPRTPPNHGTAKFWPLMVSLARLPAMRSEPFDHALTLFVTFASAPSAATPGVSVLPSSVMSGPPLPLLMALVQSVVRLAHGIQSYRGVPSTGRTAPALPRSQAARRRDR